MNNYGIIRHSANLSLSISTILLASHLQLQPAIAQPTDFNPWDADIKQSSESQRRTREHILLARLVEAVPISELNDEMPHNFDESDIYIDEFVTGERDDRPAFMTKQGGGRIYRVSFRYH